MITISMQHIQEYRQYLIQEEKSKATIEKYMRDLIHFYKFLGEPGELNKESVIAYKKYLLTVYTVNSANSMIAALNGFLAFLDLHHLKVKRYKTQRKLFCAEETELTKAEYMQLLDACGNNERLNLILQTICGTGIRISELEYFTVENVRKGKFRYTAKIKCALCLFRNCCRKSCWFTSKKNS